MYFTARFLAISAAISQVLAAPTLTNSDYDVSEGQAFTITWSGASGPVTLLLKDGASTNLQTVSTLASGLTGTSFVWTPSGLPSNTYAIEITDSTGVNYSPQFSFVGTGVASTASAASTTGTTSVSSITSVSASSTSLSATITITTTSANSSSASSTATSFSNSTTTASSTLSTATASKTTSGSSSSSTSSPINTNNSQKLGSSLAFVVMTAAALMVFS